jgi:energy-coupling factor transporter transmembrane protein EcfT
MTGIVPWLIIFLYTLQPGSESAAEVPGFVYGIIVALFIFFNTFAFNQAFQYKKVGPWKNYLYGEAAYITLSLVAKINPCLAGILRSHHSGDCWLTNI